MTGAKMEQIMPTANSHRLSFVLSVKSGAAFVCLLVLRLLQRVVIKLGHFFNKIEKGTYTRIQNDQTHTKAVAASTQYNMREAPGEKYYAKQYWGNFKDFLPAEESSPTIVDLGCGQGRFSLDFARKYPRGRIIGVDLSALALSDAKAQATENKLTNIEFVCSTIDDSVDSFEPSSIDILIFTEVSFYDPNWRKSFQALCSKVKPGGLIIASFRSTYFNLLLMTAEQRLMDAKRVVNTRHGQLWAQNPVEFSWNNSSEIVQEIQDQNLDVQRVTGIGSCSGITGDPHAKILKPWKLSQEDQDCLMQVELEIGPIVPDAGRYILIVARKNIH